MAGGAPTSVPLSVTYDPFTSDQITISRDIDISTLNWSYLRWFYNKLELEARTSALGEDSGMPLWGLVIDPVDFDYMREKDPDIREDFRYDEPRVNIANYGMVKQYKGFTLMYDLTTPRFKVIDVTATTQVLERVLPYTTEATTVDNKVVVNEDYLNAIYAMGIIFMKDVYEILVPPTISNPGGNTEFGVVPNLMGDFSWLNIQDRCDNPKKEKGFYMATFEAFARPLKWSDQAIAFLYKRCPQTEITTCVACDSVTSDWAVITAATAVVNTDLGETATSYTTVEITIGTCFDGEPPAEIQISYANDASVDVTGVLVDDSEKPKYQVVFASAANYVNAATIVANTSAAKIV